MTNEIIQSIKKLEKWVSDKNYKGYDPYDGLNSKILNYIKINNKYFRIAWIQILKRSPVNLRPLLFVPTGCNPKGMGLFLASNVAIYKKTSNPENLKKCKMLAEWLIDHSEKKFTGSCWGYNFDWQSRTFFIPKNTPTIVNTAFIGHAFLDLFNITKEKKNLEIAASACKFIKNDLNVQKIKSGKICFSYTPIDKSKIHNANLLGASLLSRVSQYQNSKVWKNLIEDSTNFSLSKQHENGSWHYGEDKNQHWIDSYHTGFNLIALRHINNFLENERIKKSIDLGEVFYSRNFFTKDGKPKFLNNSLYPIDVHCPSTALKYFSEIPKYQILADKIYHWFTKNMQKSDGSFIFQINKFYKNKTSYIRWGQAWALYGLSSYLLFHSKNGKNSF